MGLKPTACSDGSRLKMAKLCLKLIEKIIFSIYSQTVG